MYPPHTKHQCTVTTAASYIVSNSFTQIYLSLFSTVILLLEKTTYRYILGIGIMPIICKTTFWCKWQYHSFHSTISLFLPKHVLLPIFHIFHPKKKLCVCVTDVSNVLPEMNSSIQQHTVIRIFFFTVWCFIIRHTFFQFC